MGFDTYVFTGAGGRDYNEDAAAVRELSDDGLLCVVADGLGGHQHGEIASEIAVSTLTEAEPPGPSEDGGDWLAARFEAANEAILQKQTETHATLKSTVVALLHRKNATVWANVGDSRLYYLHGGDLTSVTEDHSVAYRKYKAGEISRGDICFDADQSSLLRALGNPERHQPGVYHAETPAGPGDGFLLCSDGAWEYLPDGEILIDFLKAASAKEWAELLLLRVLGRIRPDSDNLSLITVMLHGGDEP